MPSVPVLTEPVAGSFSFSVSDFVPPNWRLYVTDNLGNPEMIIGQAAYGALITAATLPGSQVIAIRLSASGSEVPPWSNLLAT